MTEIIIYSTQTCPNCKLLKNLFKKENIIFNEVDMDTPESLTKLVSNGIYTMSAPVLQINDKYFTTKELCSQDKLDFNKVYNIIEANNIETKI